MYYGLTRKTDLREIAFEVCECLGHGLHNSAFNLLLETAGAETHRGQIRDRTEGAGTGLTQFDKLPFYDTKARVSQKDKERVKEYFDIDVDSIEWQDLRYNPLLALLFARLKYKKIPQAVPITIRERAEYWKQHYNSYLGKGTVNHYIKANEYYTQDDAKFLSA